MVERRPNKNAAEESGATPPAPRRQYSITRYFIGTRLDFRALHRLLRAKHPNLRFLQKISIGQEVATPLERMDNARGNVWCMVPRPSLGPVIHSEARNLWWKTDTHMGFEFYPSDSYIEPGRRPEDVRAPYQENGRHMLRFGRLSGPYFDGDGEAKRFLSGVMRLVAKIATVKHDAYWPEGDRWMRDHSHFHWYGFHALQWCHDDPKHHWLEGWSQPTRDWKFPEGLKWYDPPYGTADDDLSTWP